MYMQVELSVRQIDREIVYDYYFPCRSYENIQKH